MVSSDWISITIKVSDKLETLKTEQLNLSMSFEVLIIVYIYVLYAPKPFFQ